MKVIFVLVLIFADAWAFFHAEKVTHLDCAVTTTTVDTYTKDKNGHEIYVDKYSADAHAHREGMDPELQEWSQQLGEWDTNDKGMDSAIDACKAWMKASKKKVRIAHGGTK